MQRKLTRSEVGELGLVLNKLDRAAEIIGCNDARQCFPDVVDMLANMRIHQTSDGKPWVEPEKVVDDAEHGRLRDLAIDAAVHRLIMAQHPTLTVIEVQRRCRTECVPGSCVYTIFFDNKVVAKIDLISPRRFAIEIQESKEKA